MAYPERGLLEQHLVGHTMERRFICDICNAALKRKDHLTRHKQSHNPSGRTSAPSVSKRSNGRNSSRCTSSYTPARSGMFVTSAAKASTAKTTCASTRARTSRGA
ncbi:uncharacterized protein [Choristoneura fumiferana]|uniref:uncharacterized protein n=1 Tax=Choristoneura fumiferana TaxID=7141 RepID=UPI003D1548A4